MAALGCDLAHFSDLWLLCRGWCHPFAIFREGVPYPGKGPLQVLLRSSPLLQVATPKVFGRATDPWKLRQGRWSCILPKQWGDAGRSSEQCFFLPPGPWLVRGEVQSFGWGGSTSPFHHVAPQCARDTWFLVGDRGHVRVPRQETILMAHQHPGLGGDQSEKLRFFGVAKLLGAPPNQAPHAPAKWLHAWGGLTSFQHSCESS